MATRIVAAMLLAGALICTIPVVPRATGNEDRAEPSKKVDMKTEFERLYLESKKTPSYSSNPEAVISENPAYMRLIALGPRCVPLIWKKVDNGVPDRVILMGVAARILKVKPDAETRARRETFKKWLRMTVDKGYGDAKGRFAALKAKWTKEKTRSKDMVLWSDASILDQEFKVIRTKRKLTKLGEVYQSIEGLGVFVLPCLIDDLAAGNLDWLPIVEHLTDGKAPMIKGRASVDAKRCVEWWKKHKAQWTVPLFEK